ncbi:hypothetical protein VTN77DRAFT_9580 [Rasamsonia byssochlamydoides]|uniref:uncharacterized protein n=1 Tax=Rasamsonia byssochlamydoides TaxID=89139 RepID=UPI003743F485
MEASRTISELKSAFIRSQVRILTAALAPQEGWRDYAPESEEDLSEKVVEEALQKLNTILKQHNRVVYSTQAIHHVARQIECLYWESIKRDAGNPESNSSGIEIGADLSNHLIIERLPTEWQGDDVSPEERQRYDELRKRLIELDGQRQRQQQRLAQYKQLEALLEPFKDPQKNIQPNLITRDGELTQALDKMRMLVARVAGRLSQGRGIPREDQSAMIPSTDPDQKLAAVLEMT